MLKLNLVSFTAVKQSFSGHDNTQRDAKVAKQLY